MPRHTAARRTEQDREQARARRRTRRDRARQDRAEHHARRASMLHRYALEAARPTLGALEGVTF